ncbi:MAG: redoxin domain-containing protein [Planctomycetes bacterium]|nr:redoxin domain-containing protein [Planctomycetota bacterium]
MQVAKQALLGPRGWRPMAAAVLGVMLMPCVGIGDPIEDFSKLEQEMESANEAYHAALAARRVKDPGFDEADKAKLPPDRRGAILAKMDALVKANTKKPGGFDMANMTLYWSLELESEESPARFAGLVEAYPDLPDQLDQLKELQYRYQLGGTPEAWIDVTARLAAKTKNEDVRPAARFLIAKIQMDMGKLEVAKRAFAKIGKGKPESDLAKYALGFVFEIEHLQVGMEAPQFEATTLDGKKVSLKSLRGKAVLLDFWASW